MSERVNQRSPRAGSPREARRLLTLGAASLGILMLPGSSTALGAPGNEMFRLLAGDGAANDEFSRSVAITGSLAAAGAQFDDDNGVDSGSVYLFDAATGLQIRKLTAGDGAAGDRFGFSVALSGNSLVVGALLDDDNGSGSGSAYLYDTVTGQLITKLLPNDGAASDHFGQSVAIDGGTVVVGSPRDDDNGIDSGSAYVFDAATGLQVVKLLAPDGAAVDLFGTAVAISGTTVLVGTPADDDNGPESGSVYLFDAATGLQTGKLVAGDGTADDGFGSSLAAEGPTVVVGAPLDDPSGSSSGSAYLFDITTRLELTKLQASDGAQLAHFGAAVAVDGDSTVVGAYGDQGFTGAIYRFDTDTGEQRAKLLSSDAAFSDFFGASVAISGSTLVVGSWLGDGNAAQSGTAYVFDDIPGTPFCFAASGCPCGNDDPTAGCVNSSGAGARLCGSGSTSVAADDLVLTAVNIPSPNANGIFFMGPDELPPFTPPGADGYACTGGGWRFGGILDDNLPPNEMTMTGVVAAAAAGGVQISAGETWNFQGWTRDPGASPCGGGTNVSSAYAVTFTP